MVSLISSHQPFVHGGTHKCNTAELEPMIFDQVFNLVIFVVMGGHFPDLVTLSTDHFLIKVLLRNTFSFSRTWVHTSWNRPSKQTLNIPDIDVWISRGALTSFQLIRLFYIWSYFYWMVRCAGDQEIKPVIRY